MVQPTCLCLGTAELVLLWAMDIHSPQSVPQNVPFREPGPRRGKRAIELEVP